MASIILGSAGAAAGSIVGGPFGAAVGRMLGSFAGRFIDNKLFSSNTHNYSSGPRLKDLSIQTSSYGITIPIIFGVVRIAGNIIWAQPFKEVAANQTYSRGGKGAKARHTHTTYSYLASFAISICEGEIDEVLRIFAGQKLLDIANYNIRIYKGCETQNPDTLIESIEGVGKTPAFRGQAYIVFEDFPLSEFGNHLPNINFEVRKKAFGKDEQIAQDLIRSIVIIPGGGEYVYDTVPQYKSIGNLIENQWCQRGKPTTLNQHTNTDKANAVVAIDDLQKSLPNAEWVAVVVNWFGTSLTINNCEILPGVEYNDHSSYTQPDPWNVCGRNRYNAHLISNRGGRANYGGTINDAALLRFIQDLKNRGLKVMLYPIIFLDLIDKPWRGYIGGDVGDIESFFEKANGYNEFITHYAKLLQGNIDALIIGSELRSLTSIKHSDNSFPVVDKFIQLAKSCRKILGPSTKLTYAADWSEYHHTDGGWYHLDKLWASPDIDVIGIDAYFPLTNSTYTVYDTKEIQKGWISGEGYDFYYEDEKRTSKQSLAPEYAWKNIAWWWENYHTNPDGKTTEWIPKSKKIWFTEYGFPSLDCCTNQPNVFYDSQNTNPIYPIHSKGLVDFRAQNQAIIATELFWQNSEMIENKFLWCWDARPYPYWPDLLHIWSDGKEWQKGHWVQGKMNLSTLAGVLSELTLKTNLDITKFTTNLANINIDGLVIDSQTKIRTIIEILQKAYQFDTMEKDGKIAFLGIQSSNTLNISYDELAKLDNTPALQIKRVQEIDLPQKIDINYVDIAKNYQISNQHAHKALTVSKEKLTFDIPLVMSTANAKLIAERTIHDMWNGRNYYNFYLPPKFIHLAPGDIVAIKYKRKMYKVKIFSIQIGKNNLLKIEALGYKEFKRSTSIINDNVDNNNEFAAIGETILEILDIPYLPKFALDESYVLIGARSKTKNWDGATIYSSINTSSNYKEISYVNNLATFGYSLNALGKANPCLIDYKNSIIVNLEYGELNSVSLDDIYGGVNLCLIGKELVQFQNARQIDSFQYELSTFFRGKYGTEHHIETHSNAEKFILINEALQNVEIPIQNIGQTCFIKAVTNNLSLGVTKNVEFTYQANCLKATSPVYIKLNAYNNHQKQLIWIRRNKQTAELNDFTDIAYEMKHQEYLVHLYDKANNLLNTYSIRHESLLINNNELLECDSIKVSQLNNLHREGFYGNLNISKININ